MSSYLKLLPMDLSRITEFIEPTDEVDDDDEEVIGDMSEEQKQIFTKVQNLTEELLGYLGSTMIPDVKKMMSLRNRGDIPALEKFMETAQANYGKGDEIKAKISLLRQLLDILVKDEYSAWGPLHDVGYRKGFKIVKYRIV